MRPVLDRRKYCSLVCQRSPNSRLASHAHFAASSAHPTKTPASLPTAPRIQYDRVESYGKALLQRKGQNHDTISNQTATACGGHSLTCWQILIRSTFSPRGPPHDNATFLAPRIPPHIRGGTGISKCARREHGNCCISGSKASGAARTATVARVQFDLLLHPA